MRNDGVQKPAVVFSGGRGRDGGRAIAELAATLAGDGCAVLIERETAAAANLRAADLPRGTTFANERDIRGADLAAVFGGDGAFIAAARRLAPLGLPLLGINLGTLGFLTDLSPRNMRAGARRIVAGKFREERRMMMSVEANPDSNPGPDPNPKPNSPRTLVRNPVRNEGVGEGVGGSGKGSGRGKGSGHNRTGVVVDEIAVNDLVISRGHGGRLVSLSVFISRQFAFALRADGLIVATPTGSTAYNLAAGGPIVEPELDAFSLAPLAPHALAHRPLLVGGEREIAVRVDAAQEAFLHIDGQVDFSLRPGDWIVARRHPERLRVRHPPGHDYFETLRRKLRWGEHADSTAPARLRAD